MSAGLLPSKRNSAASTTSELHIDLQSRRLSNKSRLFFGHGKGKYPALLSILSTMKSAFRAPLALFSTAHVIQAAGQHVFRSSSASEDFSFGNGYSLTHAGNHVNIALNDEIFWSAAVPFVSASAGRDIIVGSSGAFNITKVDENVCQDQTISNISKVNSDGALDGQGVRLSGELLDCGGETAAYEVTFYVPADMDNRVAFDIDIDSSASDVGLRRIYFSFSSHANEDFYGLGAQGSFASLKNQSVPVFSREQGVGRGDQPVTGYLNE